MMIVGAHETVVALAVGLLALSASLLLHHGWKHASDRPQSSARRESCWGACYFQLKDVAHFETWILICLFNAVAVVLPCLIHSIAIGGSGSEVSVAVSVFVALASLLVLVYSITIAACTPGLTGAHLLHNVANHETWILVSLTCALNVGWTLVHPAAQCSGYHQ